MGLQCRLEAHPGYKIKVSGNLDLLETIFEFFASYQLIKAPVWIYGKRRMTTTRVNVNLIERFEKRGAPEPYLIVDRGYFVYLILYLYQLKQKHGIEYKTDYEPKSELKLTKEWREILRDYQITAFEEIVKLKGGATQLSTGTGKGELILAICMSFLRLHPDKNILITAPKNAVVEELKLRFEQYAYADFLSEEVSERNEVQFSFLPRIKVLNPLGYARSNEFDNPANDKWLASVGMVIYDELHRSINLSYTRLKDKLLNVEYAYGFSATNSTKRLNVVNNFRLFNYEEQKRLGMTGPAMVHKFAKDMGKSIEYIRVYGNFGKGDPRDGTDYPKIVDSMTREPKFLETIRTIITRCGDKMFFVPIPFIEAGERIYNYLTAQGINALHWTGDFSHLPDGVKCLEDVKREIKTGKYRALIATATASEGVDIAELGAVILTCGSGDKSIPQNLGRAGRRGKPIVFNLYNEEQSTLRNQASRRHTIINVHYETSPLRWDL